MKIKKLILSLIVVLGLVVLAGCSSGNAGVNKNVVTMKGNTVEVIDIYNEAKLFPNLSTTQLIQNLTFEKIFEHEFGKQVTDKKVTDEFADAQKQYGKQFSSYLSQQGLTEDAYKAQIRFSLLQQAAIDKETIDNHLTAKDLEAAWETYHPTVDAYIAVSNSETDAKKNHDSAVNHASDFKKQASTDKLEHKFDSSDTSIPEEVRTAAFKLKDGQTSDVLKVADSTSGATTYYVIYMIKNPGKGNNMKDYKKQLENYIKVTKRADSTYVQAVMKNYLTEYNVSVKEQAFSSIFSQYLGNN